MILPFQDSLVKQPLHSSLCQQHNENQTHQVRLTILPIIEAFEKSAERKNVHNWVKAFRNNSYHWILMDSYEKWRNLLQSDQPLLDLRIHWAYEQPHPLENKSSEQLFGHITVLNNKSDMQMWFFWSNADSCSGCQPACAWLSTRSLLQPDIAYPDAAVCLWSHESYSETAWS